MVKFFKYFFSLLIFVSGAVPFAFGDTRAVSLDNPLELLEKSFDSRKSIKSVHAILNSQYSEENGIVSEQEYRLIYDGENKRFFFDIPLLSEEYCTCFPDNKQLLAVMHFRKQSQLLKTNINPNVKIDLGINDYLSVEDISSRVIGYSNNRNVLVFPQFEFFGYSPKTVLNYRLTDYRSIIKEKVIPFSRSQNVTAVANNIIYDSLPMTEVQISSLNDTKTRKSMYRAVFDTSKNLFPVLVENTSAAYDEIKKEVSEIGLVESITTTPALHEPSRCWYPLKWKYQRHQNSKLISKEEVNVKLISLNEPIDSNFFTLKGLEHLKPDTHISWQASSLQPPAKGSLIWDGEKIIGGFPTNNLFESIPSGHPRWLTMVIVDAIILSLFFIIYFYRRYRQTNA